MAEDAIHVALEAAEEFKPTRPDGLLNDERWPYRLTAKGVELRFQKEDQIKWRRIAPPLEVLADARDGEGRNWSRQVGFSDRDARRHEILLPMAEIGAGRGMDLLALLASHGYEAPSQNTDRQKLLAYVMEARPASRLRTVERLGWRSGAYVLPDRVIGAPEGERVSFQPPSQFEHAFRQAGRLEGWGEEVAALCVGNSRLALALSMGFAAPLLELLEEEGGGVHLRGASSLGKTTALAVAASLWGGGDPGYIRSWRATANALEGVALGHNDGLLCLDELGECDARAASDAAYMLANGAGKSRASRSGAARPAARWRLLFLSTGELSLSDKIAEAGPGKRARAGQELRFLDLPADAGAGLGLFETLHGAGDGASLSKALKEAALARHYGHAGPAFLAWAAPRREDLREVLKVTMAGFIAKAAPEGAAGQVSRAARRFALIGAAGELAREAGILPWPEGEALRAAHLCFQVWLEERGGDGSAEARAAVEQMRAFLEAHGASRFQAADGQGERILNRAGFWRAAPEGGREYLIPSASFREIAAGLDPKLALQALAAAGILRAASQSLYVAAEGRTMRLHVLRLPEETEHG